ncbi:hypothetical protein [Pectobacterium versatile]|uniref:hypothetical protein n=1 Tax=Pectobacterium versatile TaxID=2488639 RepID=UPI00384DFAE2
MERSAHEAKCLKPPLTNKQTLVVILVVLTEKNFSFRLLISQLLAKAIPVRGATFLFSCRFANSYVIQIQ